jgi:hypothetical protein
MSNRNWKLSVTEEITEYTSAKKDSFKVAEDAVLEATINEKAPHSARLPYVKYKS